MSGGNLYWRDVEPHFRAMSERMEHMEQAISELCAKQGIQWEPLSAGAPQEIKDLVREGKTLEAIKAYRELFPALDADAARAEIAKL